jgi:hypothetical protein
VKDTEDDLGAWYPDGVDGICACDAAAFGVGSEEAGRSGSCGWGFQEVGDAAEYEPELGRGVGRGTRWCGPPGQASCPRQKPS